MRCFIQELTSNFYSFLDLLLHGSSSSVDGDWQYQQCYQRLQGRKPQLSFGLSIKSTHPEFEQYKVDFENNKTFLVLFSEYGGKIPIKSSTFRNVAGCQNFSVLQTYLEIYIFCVMQYIESQKQSVGSALKVLAKFLKTVFLQLICIVSSYPQSFQANVSPR